jgi:glycosyltransferase involved in cell wall biosynthesis
MQVVLSTLGKFHTFDLARQLQQRGSLRAVFTGYPAFKLKNESLPKQLVHTFPLVHGAYMAAAAIRARTPVPVQRFWEYWDRKTLDYYVSKRLPACDVFVALSGAGLISGRTARKRGARFVCDRGSSHIRTQRDLLREEHEIWGIQYTGIDPRIVDLEEAEYAEADCITVPSSFNRQSFIDRGVPADKVKLLSYGVDLSRFHPSGAPDTTRFDVLFAGSFSVRKGVPYLLQAFQKLRHPRKSLTFAGPINDSLVEVMKKSGFWSGDIRMLGNLPQTRLRELMSTSHVMVLPSIEEGLAMVQAQAMACRCPVIATEHTGARDLFEDGRQGWILPIRDSDAVAYSLQRLAEDPALRDVMAEEALVKVHGARGWDQYGDQATSLYLRLVA